MRYIFAFLACLLPLSALASTSHEVMEETMTKMEQLALNKPQEANPAPAPTPAVKQPAPQTTSFEPRKRLLHASLGYDLSYMHYRETSDGDTLDKDYGFMHGLYINLGYKSDVDFEFDINGKEIVLGKPFIEGYYRRADHHLTYDGSTLGGTPLKHPQHSFVQNFGIKAGLSRNLTEKGEVYAYVDGGRRIWQRGENRTIDGAYEYAEKYVWLYAGGGIGATYRPIPKFSSGIDIEGLIGVQPKMHSDLYEGATFQLGSVSGVEVKLPLKYYMLQNLSWDLTPYYSFWRIKRSDPAVISGVSYQEPDSRTHVLALQTGLTYCF